MWMSPSGHSSSRPCLCSTYRQSSLHAPLFVGKGMGCGSRTGSWLIGSSQKQTHHGHLSNSTHYACAHPHLSGPVQGLIGRFWFRICSPHHPLCLPLSASCRGCSCCASLPGWMMLENCSLYSCETGDSGQPPGFLHLGHWCVQSQTFFSIWEEMLCKGQRTEIGTLGLTNVLSLWRTDCTKLYKLATRKSELKYQMVSKKL